MDAVARTVGGRKERTVQTVRCVSVLYRGKSVCVCVCDSEFADNVFETS